VVTCEACSGNAAPFCAVYGTWYYRCNSCELVQLPSNVDEAFVRQTYSDQYFYGGGAGYPNYPDESRLLREHGQRYARRLSRFVSPARVLDIGGAAGYIAQGFRDFGWTPTICEPNEQMGSIAASLGHHVSIGTFESFTTSEPFELATMIQVLEHFYDLRKALEIASNVTALGGWLLIETWNGGSLTARLLGTQWHEFSPPSVRRVFTPSVLDRTLRRYGFKRIAQGRPQKWISGSHAKSLLVHKSSADNPVMRVASAAARCLPDHVRIPYPAEDLFWALYRSETVPMVQSKSLKAPMALAEGAIAK
jgi:hypothetical protein